MRVPAYLGLLATAALVSACASVPTVAVPASVETAPMTGTGDRADDPAIWVHPTDVSRSLILGTNKDEGLHVYALDGSERAFLPVGMVNNVDVRGNLAVASNDQVNGLSWFAIDPDTDTVTHIGDTPVTTVEPYGVCSGLLDGVYIAGVTYKTGEVELWAAPQGDDGMIAPSLMRTVTLSSQLEGCVFDDAASRLFIGEEGKGVWSLDLGDPASTPQPVDMISDGNGLKADVEGISLWLGEGQAGYLVVSAQSADRFVIYDRQPPHAFRGAITVSASTDGTIDAVSHTDGLDVTSVALPGYPRGLLVVQDDANPSKGVDQNFKLVDWAGIERALGLAQ
jgi:3-phytase